LIETGKISFNKHYLKTSVEVNLNIEKTFNFFSKPSNLNLITPNWLNFNILNTSDVNSFEGAKFYYNLKLHGITIKWNSIISEWNPYKSFRDIQIKGPYSYWNHLHTFTQKKQKTLVEDKIIYSMFGGSITNNIFVKKDLIKIFTYRLKQLNLIFNRTQNN
tara:strand:+ start:10383 stop:10865 length:483 start_codon:yes stop_codon:yes gene_type:complete